jgi:D-proline reductase (dithiol) PrdB
MFDPNARYSINVNLNYNMMPFVRPGKSLRESRLALVTTGGVHLPEQPRFDIDDPSGDCSYREIPTDASALTWTHEYYAPDRSVTDLDSVFPLWTLRGLVDEGVVGALGSRHFSFMGAMHEPEPLVEGTAPEVAEKLAEDEVDAVLLTPS